MKAFKLLALTSCVLLAAGNGVAQQNYSKSEGLLQYVDPYIGSGYHGHVFVGTSVPYGMVQLGPTNIHKGWDWCSGYHYSDSILIGFSHTHLSGTGCTDLCDILIMPLNEIRTPRGNQDDIRDGYASRYSHANEIARPEYYSLLLDRYNIKAELTATDRVGFHRYTYPEGKPASILIDLREGNGSNAYDSYIRKVDDYTVEGYRYVRGWSPSRKVYFVLKSDKKIEQFTAYDDNTPQPWDQLKVASVKSVLTFGNVKEVKIKVALSSVSCDNAAMNLQSELTHWDFDKVVDMSADRWNKQLEKMTVETDDEASKRVFYTAHYHTMIAPTLFCDVNGEYRGMNDMIYTDPKKANYTTLSLWDTYRALNPLMTITQPEMVDHVVNSMISIYRQQDKLPIWPLMSGETDQMPGYSSVPVIADAYLKGFTGFDAEEALQAMIATATYEKQKGVPYVVKKRYIPADKVHEATSIAMEYAVDDWGIAAMARKMGKAEDAETFSKRAHYYKNYFDSSIHFIRPKLEDGSWRTPYDPARSIHTVGDFCEGNGWQYTFFVPQNPARLIEKVGKDEFNNRLDSIFTEARKSIFGGGKVVNAFSGLQSPYNHGNQPSLHISWLFNFSGKPYLTQKWTRLICDEFYGTNGEHGYGYGQDEDQGQLGAWYVMAAMGLFDVQGGACERLTFQMGSPLFDKIEIKLSPVNATGKTFVIETTGNTPDAYYVQSATLNGKPLEQCWLYRDELYKGGTLKLTMGNQPNEKWGVENPPHCSE